MNAIKLFLFVMLLPISWQVFNPLFDNLFVYYGDANSDICYVGTPAEYDGSCVEPKAPTSEYVKKYGL